MSRLTAFEEEARALNRSLRFLWLATFVAVGSLLLARGVSLLVWSGVVVICLLALLLARHAYLRLARRIEELPPRARAKARSAVLRQGGRYLFLRLEER